MKWEPFRQIKRSCNNSSARQLYAAAHAGHTEYVWRQELGKSLPFLSQPLKWTFWQDEEYRNVTQPKPTHLKQTIVVLEREGLLD